MTTHPARNHAKRLCAPGLLTACALTLASCSVSSPLAVRSSALATGQGNADIAITLPPEDASGQQPLKTRFAGAMMDAFADHGVSVSDDGGLLADYAVSVSSAEIGLQTNSDDQSAPVQIAAPRPARRFDECEAMVLRGSLLLIDKTSGAVAYRGTGAMTECDFDDTALRAMADGLIADFIARQ